MPTVPQGPRAFLALDVGETLTVTADSASSGLVRHLASSPGSVLTGIQVTSVPASGTRIFGPFPTVRAYSLECAAGALSYALTKDDFGRSVLLGNIEGFTGNRTLIAEDNGKILRSDDSTNVTLTVPNYLSEGFNIGFAMFGTGTVSVVAGSGATNRSSTLALINQYDVGSLLVLKNSGGAAAEFVLGGAFV